VERFGRTLNQRRIQPKRTAQRDLLTSATSEGVANLSYDFPSGPQSSNLSRVFGFGTGSSFGLITEGLPSSSFARVLSAFSVTPRVAGTGCVECARAAPDLVGPCPLTDYRIEFAMSQALRRPPHHAGSVAQTHDLIAAAMKSAPATNPRPSPPARSTAVGPSRNVHHPHSANDPCNYLG
jgi:hypothetical protein